MNTLVVYAHPSSTSFNAAIRDEVTQTLTEQGHDVRIHDLYAMNFNPVLDADDFASFGRSEVPEDVAAEQDAIRWADSLVFVYPVWWWDRPAILKGWVDRVIRYGFAFEYGPEGLKGLLNHKTLVIQTHGSTTQMYEAFDAQEAPRRTMMNGTLKFAGIEDATYQAFYGVATSDEAQRQAWLQEVREAVQALAAGEVVGNAVLTESAAANVTASV
ncbi:MAG: NAD(P)H-dependent oxidoreductase [Deinococcota bacterium]